MTVTFSAPIMPTGNSRVIFLEEFAMSTIKWCLVWVYGEIRYMKGYIRGRIDRIKEYVRIANTYLESNPSATPREIYEHLAREVSKK